MSTSTNTINKTHSYAIAQSRGVSHGDSFRQVNVDGESCRTGRLWSSTVSLVKKELKKISRWLPYNVADPRPNTVVARIRIIWANKKCRPQVNWVVETFDTNGMPHSQYQFVTSQGRRNLRYASTWPTSTCLTRMGLLLLATHGRIVIVTWRYLDWTGLLLLLFAHGRSITGNWRCLARTK